MGTPIKVLLTALVVALAPRAAAEGPQGGLPIALPRDAVYVGSVAGGLAVSHRLQPPTIGGCVAAEFCVRGAYSAGGIRGARPEYPPRAWRGFSASGFSGGVQAPRAPKPQRWETTASDPEMQELTSRLGFNRDCGTDRWMYRHGFRGDGKRFVAGGDRLARYLITQHELALAAGAIDAWRYLYYTAYTESDTALYDLSDRIWTATEAADSAATAQLLRIAGVVARPEIVDDLLDVLESGADPSIAPHAAVRLGAVHALGKVLDYTEVDRPDAVALLRAIEWDEAEDLDTRKAAWRALNRLELYQLTEPRNEYPPEFGAPQGYALRAVEKSRQVEAQLLQRHPERAGPDGCVPDFMHCGLAEWAIGD